MSMLNIILKSDRINIALLHDKISNKCHKIKTIGTLTCFIYTFCLFRFQAQYLNMSKNIYCAELCATSKYEVVGYLIFK